VSDAAAMENFYDLLEKVLIWKLDNANIAEATEETDNDAFDAMDDII